MALEPGYYRGGYVRSNLQVDQTGKISPPNSTWRSASPARYSTLLVSRMQAPIVAINNDGEALIFDIADFGLVGDLFKSIPELEQALV